MKKTYGSSAFNRVWKKLRERWHDSAETKGAARFWFNEGFKELQRIQCEKAERQKQPKSSNPPGETL